MNSRVPLALRGLWWRRGLSIAIVVTAAVTTAAAALGPLYARAAAESTLRDELTQSLVQDSGLHFQATSGPDLSMVDMDRFDHAITTALKPGALAAYPRRVQGLTWATGATASHAVGVQTQLVWRSGECAHLTIVKGRCATGAHEAMVSARTVAFSPYGWRLGKTLSLSGGQTVKIVGVYRPNDTTGPFWFGANYFPAAPGNGSAPDTVDSVFVTRAEFEALPARSLVRGSLDYPLDPSAIRLAGVPALRADVARLTTRFNATAPLTLTTDLGDVLDAAAHQQQLVDAGTLLVTLQLTLLGWLVLFQVVADAAESRGAEIALAKLRGHRFWRTLRFGLGEPIVLLLAAIPIGLGLAILAAHAFAGSILVPGTPVTITWQTFAAALAAFAGGIVAAALAGRDVLVRSVLEQWRRTRIARQHTRAALWVDVSVSIAAVAGLVTLQLLNRAGSGDDNAALLAPGLLVLAVALVGMRVLPLLVRAIVPATRATRRMALFLASRQVVRRPAGLRLAALLAVAVGLATFAVGAESVASGNRTARAQAELGAATTVSIQFATGVDPTRAVRRADPDGKWAMAVATWLPDGGNAIAGTVLGVDASRLSAVGYAARGGISSTALAKVIGTSSVPTITLHATRITATITAGGLAAASAPQVQFNLLSKLGAPIDAESTLLAEGTHDYAATIPCAKGCTFTGLTWDRPIATAGAIHGSATVTALAAGTGTVLRPIDAHLDSSGAWRAEVPSGNAADRVQATRKGVSDRFSSRNGGFGGIAYASVPSPIPAVATHAAITLQGQGTRTQTMTDGFGVSTGFRVEQWTSVLPSVLDDGVVMNLGYLRQQLPDFDNEAVWSVWLSPSAPPTAVAKLRAAGLDVQSTSTEQTRVAELARQGPALSLLLLLASAIIGAILVAGGTAITIGASARRRSYEAAALQAVGVSRRQLYRATLYEQAILLGMAVVLGIPGGICAALLALPVIPEFATSTPVQLVYTPTPAPIFVFTIGFAALVIGVAAATAAVVLRSARPTRLREAEE